MRIIKRFVHCDFRKMGQAPLSGKVDGKWDKLITLRGEGTPPSCTPYISCGGNVWLCDVPEEKISAVLEERPSAVRVEACVGHVNDIVRLQGFDVNGPTHNALYVSLGPSHLLEGSVLLRGLRYTGSDRGKFLVPRAMLAEASRLLPYEGERFSSFPIESLPRPVLSMVFEYLSPQDRQRAALTCRSFSRALRPAVVAEKEPKKEGRRRLLLSHRQRGVAHFLKVPGDMKLRTCLGLSVKQLVKRGILPEEKAYDRHSYDFRVALRRCSGTLIIEYDFSGVNAMMFGGKGIYHASISLGELLVMKKADAQLTWGGSKFWGEISFPITPVLEFVKAELCGKYEVPCTSACPSCGRMMSNRKKQ